MLNNINFKLYLSLGLIIGITFIMAMFTSYSHNILNKNNNQINSVNEKLIFFENIMTKHEQYVKSMLNSILFQKKFTKKLDPHRCEFGKWYYKIVKSSEFAKLPKNIQEDILSIENDHKLLHEVGKMIKNRDLSLSDENTQKEKFRNEFTENIPTYLENMKKGLNPYLDYLIKQRNETISTEQQNSNMINIMSIILTIINIVIVMIIGHWTKYYLIEKIKYLKAKYKELQTTQKQLVQSEKMASLGGMVAGVAHEINTPVGMALTAITSLEYETKNLKKSYDDEDMSEEDFEDYMEHSLKLNKSIHINLEKAATLVRSFKQVAVDQTSDQDREFKFGKYVGEIMHSLNSKLKRTNIKIKVDVDKDLSIYSNPGAFSQILTNFIMNSIIHGFKDKDNGIIKIKAIIDNDRFILKYSDNGRGLDEVTKQKIFDPFYTTNRSNGGSGLGMNIVFNIVTQKLQGTIDMQSSIDNGILFTINIPLKLDK